MPKRRLVNVNNIREMEEENARCAEVAWHFDKVRTCALNSLSELSPTNRERVLASVAQLEASIAGLHMNPLRDARTAEERLEQCLARRRCIEVAVLAHAALTVLDGGDAECLRLFCLSIFKGSSNMHWTFEINRQQIEVEKLPVLSRALTDDLLKIDWASVKKPLAYAAQVAHNLGWKDAKADAHTEDASFEDVVGTPAESSDYGAVTDVVFDEVAREALEAALKEAAEVDPDLAIYGTLILRGQKYKAIRRRFGWTRSHADNVQRRYLRWRNGRGQEILDQHTEYRTRGLISDASRNVYFETLHDRKHGREHGEWKHKETSDFHNPLNSKGK